MPYGKSNVLPGEAASKLGHLSVLEDPLIKELLDQFQRAGAHPGTSAPLDGSVASVAASSPLPVVVAIDGSLSDVPNTFAKHKALSYVKVGSLELLLSDLEQLQQAVVDPEVVQAAITRGATSHSTVLPLSNVALKGKSLFESVRAVVQSTFTHFYDGALLDTLRYLVSREWLADYEMVAHFRCPYCGKDVHIPRSVEEFPCAGCAAKLHLLDYLEFASSVSEEGNDSGIALHLMLVCEHLLLLNYLRELVKQGASDDVLLLKDGPLMLPGHFARLVDPIRAYLGHLTDLGTNFHMAGVEKQGPFAEHGAALTTKMQPEELFIPSNDYIFNFIKSGSSENTLYGERVLYGAKAFYRIDERNMILLSIPYGEYHADVKVDELIGARETVATLSQLGSRQFQNALLPITAINRIVSLSVFPSNKILQRLSEAQLGTFK